MKPVAECLEGEYGHVLIFRCPGCKCSHQVNVRSNGRANFPVWDWNGSLEKPTITPSILCTYGREPRPDRPQTCHSFVTDGKIQFLGDCYHELAGKTVDLPPVDD